MRRSGHRYVDDLSAASAPARQVEHATADGQELKTRDIPITLAGDAITHYDGLALVYDASGLLVTASDGATSIHIMRDATGAVLGPTGTDVAIAVARPFAAAVRGRTGHNMMGQWWPACPWYSPAESALRQR